MRLQGLSANPCCPDALHRSLSPPHRKGRRAAEFGRHLRRLLTEGVAANRGHAVTLVAGFDAPDAHDKNGPERHVCLTTRTGNRLG
jgi:hypothetical protein